MTREEAICILRNTAFLAPSLEPIDEAIDMACEALKQADNPQTEVKDGEDYLRGYNDGYYARGILDKAGVEIHIDKPRGFTLKSISDTPQTDVYDYKGNGKWERSE